MPRSPRASESPTLEGLRVLLRRPTAADSSELLELRRASWGFLRPWEPRPPRGETGWSRSWFHDFLHASWDDSRRRFLICDRTQGTILGGVGLSGITRGALEGAWLGYWLGEAHTGRGLATEGVDVALRYAFRTLGLHRVEANVRPENAPSIALLTRLGFRKEGFSPRYLKIDGDWRDHERWALLEEEWRERAR